MPSLLARSSIIGGALVLGLVLILLLVYGPRAYGAWRESRLLKRAATSLALEDFDGAKRAAHDVLQTRPDSLAALHVLAEASEKQNRPETVVWRTRIAQLQPQNLDSQLNLASAALRFGELDTARKALENISPAEHDRAAYHVVAGWLARAQGNDADVEQHFAAAVRQEPGNDLYQFNLAVLRIRSSDSEKSEPAREVLERLSKSAGFRAGSLRALLNDAVQRDDLAQADILAQELQMSQQVTFSDYLLCLDFYRKLDKQKFSAVLEKVKPVAARNSADLALLLEWLNKNDLSGEVLKWMEKLPSDLTTNPPPCIAIAEALTKAKNWSRLKRWTRNGSWDYAEYLRFAYQAYAARQSRQSADAEFAALWSAAEQAANGKGDYELNLARLASQWGLTSEAEKLWLRVSKNAPSRREALEALLRIYRANDDLPNLYRTAQRLHENSPNESGAAANYARLGLLLDQNAAEAQRVAKEAYESAPADINAAMTYAFSLYSLGRSGEGIEIMQKLPAEGVHDPHAAVYAALLLLDGNQPDAAQEYIAAAQAGSIFPEEKRLLDDAVAKANAAAPTPTPSASPL
ncbi:MAG: hypothetical protein ABJB09_03715 [Verrucomicrobiota bacterium]